MILSTRHTGLVVRDIERSISFYRDILGLGVWKRGVEEGTYIDNVVGIKGVKLEWVKLKVEDGSLVELLQYHSHPATDDAKIMSSNCLGCSHVAFTVKDLDNVYALFEKNNVHCNSKPQISPDGKAKVIYCHDPDGIIIEIVEDICE